MVVLAALQQEASEGGGSGAASIAQERGLRHASVGEHIARVHTGTMVHSTTCSGCGTRRARAEPYTTLLLPVRGHADLHATLAALVAPEELKGDNAYACDTCGGKREAARAVRLRHQRGASRRKGGPHHHGKGVQPRFRERQRGERGRRGVPYKGEVNQPRQKIRKGGDRGRPGEGPPHTRLVEVFCAHLSV